MPAPARRRSHPRVAALYALAVLREFRGTILTLLTTVGLGALVIWAAPLRSLSGGHLSFVSSLFTAWMAMLGQPELGLDERWYLLVIESLYPLLGLAVVIEGVVRLGLLMMSRRRGEREWMMVMASTYRDHVVLCGLGHLGFRILEQLVAKGTPVVALERDPDCRFLPQARGTGVPILQRDMKEDQALIDAGVPRARAIVIASNDDMANLEVALDARRMNPDIRVVMRLFDQQIAQKITSAFAVDVAFSASALAAPVVAGLVTHSAVLASYQVGELTYHTVELTVEPGGSLAGASVGALEASHQVRAICVTGCGASTAQAVPAEHVLSVGDKLVVSGPAPAVATLVGPA